MWPFRQRLDRAHLELIDQIHGLTQRVKHLEETLTALELKHERLRGRFYATRTPEEGAPAKKPESKAEILHRFGKL
jgi:hypothetical protein